MVDLSYVNDPNLVVYYVDVYDSAEAPVLFAREQTARQWALEHHPDWKVDSEMVRQRWEAGESYKGAVEEARAGGWYRPGPGPIPRTPDTPGVRYDFVFVVHGGLTTFVFQDKSDGEAVYHVWSLHPEHGSRHHLHAVPVRP